MSKRSASPPHLEKKQKTINDELPNGRYRVVESSYRYKPAVMRRVVRSGARVVGRGFTGNPPNRSLTSRGCRVQDYLLGGIVQMSETGSRCFRCIGQMEDRWESLHELLLCSRQNWSNNAFQSRSMSQETPISFVYRSSSISMDIWSSPLALF